MSHFRKILVHGVQYEYKVGKRGTYVKNIGVFSHQEIGYCHDVSMDKFSVSPKAVSAAIQKHLMK